MTSAKVPSTPIALPWKAEPLDLCLGPPCPPHCRVTVLSLYCHCTVTVLSLYCHCTVTVLPCTVTVQSLYCPVLSLYCPVL